MRSLLLGLALLAGQFTRALGELAADDIALSCTPLSKSPVALPASGFCGIDMLLGMEIKVSLDITSIDNVDTKCSLNSIPLTNVSLVQKDSKWKVRLGYTIQLSDPDSEAGVTKVKCTVSRTNETLALITETLPIAIFAYLPEIDSFVAIPPASNAAATTRPPSKNKTNLNPSIVALGIGSPVNFIVSSKSKHAVSGTCLLQPQNQVLSLSASTGQVVVRAGDPYIGVDAMTYSCNVTDVAGNSAHSEGRVLSHSMVLDGTLPVIESVFMAFSSETPAKIGSMVTLTLKAQNLTSGYSGNCSVNGVGPLELAEQTEDKKGLYLVQYHVGSGDHDVGINQTLPVECKLVNAAKNAFMYSTAVPLSFAIDANLPEIVSTKLLFSSDDPAQEESVIEIQIMSSHETLPLAVHKETCSINNVSVARSFTRSGVDTYLLTYVVGKGQAMWKPGKLPIYCVVTGFTDENTLFAREMKPHEFDPTKDFGGYLPDKMVFLSFVIVAVASHTISYACPFVGLPRITGYLATGIITGPFVLKLITTDEIGQMRFVDEVALAYIGLAAGAKLHWVEMRRKIKSILAVTLWLTLFEYVIGTLTIIVLANYLVFLQATTTMECYAIAMLAGCMMIARSPSSALAVIEETGSQGHFTTFIFSVTVLCDIVVIILFNVNNMITESFLSDKSISFHNVMELVAQMAISVAVGVLSGKFMSYIILWRTPRIRRRSRLHKLLQLSKQVVILMFGFSLFVLGHLCHPWLESLMCCMVAGATLYNWNHGSNREELNLLLKSMADFVYVGFFTLTGASLELDMLLKAMAVSVLLCLTRIFAIFLGSYIGGALAHEPQVHNRVSWMAYITQAGVTLGLAKKIQLLYPGWGSYFATMIVSVVICNQLIGPPLLRLVLRYVGDCREKENGKVDGLRALILGDDERLVVVNSAKRRMKNCGWEPFSFCMNMQDAQDPGEMNVQVREAMKEHEPMDVVVVMMSSDVLNYRVIRNVAQVCTKLKRVKILRIVVNVVGDGGDEDWATRFANMPFHEEHGDAIDVVVVDRNEATDMLIELAACGKLINQKEVLSPRADDSDATEETSVIKVSLSSKMKQMLWV
ncbi:hypothetical protein DYB25_002473 [Aphanomyces astaci]|uniref:Cation/H+ exchanger transmembrane domain-containing protein n=1 Tax=Aphanomyces astaci TaxID=112090 RepID=A0A397C5E5_APHAT|nr:hypothetical protein DYB25_002473 [Aphanomyces astaci]RHY36537.1 hypothetical protein DYB38_005234 [Aphanomyces astaci]RHY52326.1 hypothetical protein DYB34_003110 [Aphanomyces astaci]RHZ41474.1 hypothetical protein DYB31_002447 [Aphanomyces astaci]